MRLDIQREQELAKRKGSTIRTILAVIWLALCFIAAYFISEWLFDTGTLSYSFFYNRLFIPRSVPEWAVQAGFMLVIVVIMQFFVLLGYAFTSPLGRLHTGTPSAQSREPDPFDEKYDYH